MISPIVYMNTCGLVLTFGPSQRREKHMHRDSSTSSKHQHIPSQRSSRHNHNRQNPQQTTPSTMSSSYQASASSLSEKDTMSIKSASTMASTTALLRSMLPLKRSKKTPRPRYTETPAEKEERKLQRAEVLHAWSLHR